MQLDAAKVRELHSKIDRERDEQIAQATERADANARRKHEALDEVWAMVQAELSTSESVSEPVSIPTPIPQETLSTSPVSSEPPPHTNGHRRLFRTRDAVIKIINGLADDAAITQPLIYETLIDKYPQLTERNPAHLRGQIPGVLNKLVELELLYLDKKGYGITPAIYRKTKQGSQNKESAVGAADSSLPVSEHKEGLLLS